MTRAQTALKIARGSDAATPLGAPIPDRGPVLTAPEVALAICGGRMSPRWVIERMGPAIGSKPGREWFFYERDAREWWANHLANGARRKVG